MFLHLKSNDIFELSPALLHVIANQIKFFDGRKRHGVTDKEEMERSVTYESYPTDLSEGIESFQSPDTVCQYCGTDFKFFRALKHHLKTHSSCRQKPFTCSKCVVSLLITGGYASAKKKKT